MVKLVILKCTAMACIFLLWIYLIVKLMRRGNFEWEALTEVPMPEAPDNPQEQHPFKKCHIHGKYIGDICPGCDLEINDRCKIHQIPLQDLEEVSEGHGTIALMGVCPKCEALIKEALDTLDRCPKCGKANSLDWDTRIRMVRCMYTKTCGYARKFETPKPKKK